MQSPSVSSGSRRSSTRSNCPTREDPYLANQSFEELRSRVRHWIGMEEPKPYVPPTAAEFQLYKERLRLKAKKLHAKPLTSLETPSSGNEKDQNGDKEALDSLPSSEIESDFGSECDSDCSSSDVLYLADNPRNSSRNSKEAPKTRFPVVPMLRLSKLKMTSPSVGSDFDYDFSDTSSSDYDGDGVYHDEKSGLSGYESPQRIETKGGIKGENNGMKLTDKRKNTKSARRKKHLSPGAHIRMKNSILTSRRLKKLEELDPNDPSLLLFMPLHPLWSHSRDALKKSNLAHFITPREDQDSRLNLNRIRESYTKAPRTRRFRPQMPHTDRPSTIQSASVTAKQQLTSRSSAALYSNPDVSLSQEAGTGKDSQIPPKANLQNQLATFMSMPLPLVLPTPKSPTHRPSIVHKPGSSHRPSIVHRPSVSHSQTPRQKDESVDKSPRGQTQNIVSAGVSIVPIPKPPSEPRSGSDSARPIKLRQKEKIKRFGGTMSRSGSELGSGFTSAKGRQDNQADGSGQQTNGANGIRRHSSDLSMVLNMEYGEPQDFTGQMEVLQTAGLLTSGFPPQVLEEISHNMAMRRFSRAEKIVWQGGVLDGVYIVRKGTVAIFKRIDVGIDQESDVPDKRSRLERVRDIRVVKVTTCGPGDFFGEYDLLNHPNGSYTFTAQAMEDDVEVYQWNRQSFLQTARVREKEFQKRLKPHWAKLPSEQQLYRDYMESLAAQAVNHEDSTDEDEPKAAPTQIQNPTSTPAKYPNANPPPHLANSSPLPSAFRKPSSPSKNLRITIAKGE